MSKLLEKTNKKIKIDDKQYEKIQKTWKKIKKEVKEILNSNGVNSITIIESGSFGKALTTKKTQDFDSEIRFTDPNCNLRNQTSCFKILTNFEKKLRKKYPTYKIMKTRSSIEIKIKGFSYSFTFVPNENYKLWWGEKFTDLKIKLDSKNNINSLLLESNLNKHQRWNVIKYVKIMRYFFARNMQNLYSYQLENILTEKLINVKNSTALTQYEKFREFFQEFSEKKYDDNLKNLVIKNSSNFDNLESRSKNIFNKLPKNLQDLPSIIESI